MKLPRDLSGEALAKLLGRYQYRIVRQTGSHLRLTSNMMRTEHHITIPAHRQLRVGTLSAILGEVASYVEEDRDEVAQELFGS